MTVAVHDTGFVPVESVQAENVSPLPPISDDVSAIVPAGLKTGDPFVSLTVTVTVLPLPTVTDVGDNPTVVDVVRRATLSPPERVPTLPEKLFVGM